MPAGPIGSTWAPGSWADTAWEAGSWGPAQQGPPSPDLGQLFVDTISRRRVGFSTARVLVETYGEGLKRGIGHLEAVVLVEGRSGDGFRRSVGKSYADLRPYHWVTQSLNDATVLKSHPMSDRQQDEDELDAHYWASLPPGEEDKN